MTATSAHPAPHPAPRPDPHLEPHLEPQEPVLLTPGPLSTAPATRAAMLRDRGSWDADFRAITAEIRARLVAMLGAGGESYDCVPLQGSGTFAVEAMLGSLVPRRGRVLVLANGAYGQRAARILARLGRDHVVLDKGDFLPPRGTEVARALARDPAIGHVLAVHCETSSGILNPVAEIARAVADAGRKLLIDAMSSFGAIEIEPATLPFEALAGSANKCIEGVPGLAFVLARRPALEAARGRSLSLSLDLHDQWQAMNRSGQWRFTPPTHVAAAFLEALRLHAAEGGVAGRGARYLRNREALVAGMRGLGFETLLPERWLSPVITAFFHPADPAFSFPGFYEAMKARGFIIYPGKLTRVESFRLGHIGQVDARVMGAAVRAAGAALAEMGVASGAPVPGLLDESRRLMA